jgi:tRNA(adenine34) deaminase
VGRSEGTTIVNSSLNTQDRDRLERAIELAVQAEKDGNLPIGCVISRGGVIVAEGRNTIWAPANTPHRHAEMEALAVIPVGDREVGGSLTLYTTLEPCLMCAGAISLYGIGRVVYGSKDPLGGALTAFEHLPPYFERYRTAAEWIGPALPEACDPLFERAIALIEARDPDVRQLLARGSGSL